MYNLMLDYSFSYVCMFSAIMLVTLSNRNIPKSCSEYTTNATHKSNQFLQKSCAIFSTKVAWLDCLPLDPVTACGKVKGVCKLG